MLLVPGSINEKITSGIDMPVCDCCDSYLKKRVGKRVSHLLAIPVEVITRLVDGILGIGGCLALLLTGGKISRLTEFTLTHSVSCLGLLAIVNQRTLLAINPHVRMRVEEHRARMRKGNEFFDLGIVSAVFFNAVENFLRKPSTRFTYKLAKMSLAVPLLLTSMVDATIGIFAGIFSVITLGTWKKCNNLAYEHLNLTVNSVGFTFLLDPKSQTDNLRIYFPNSKKK